MIGKPLPWNLTTGGSCYDTKYNIWQLISLESSITPSNILTFKCFHLNKAFSAPNICTVLAGYLAKFVKLPAWDISRAPTLKEREKNIKWRKFTTHVLAFKNKPNLEIFVAISTREGQTRQWKINTKRATIIKKQVVKTSWTKDWNNHQVHYSQPKYATLHYARSWLILPKVSPTLYKPDNWLDKAKQYYIIKHRAKRVL